MKKLKKLIEIVACITATVVICTVFLGIMTLGVVFQFENYDAFDWILVGVYYIVCISAMIYFTYDPIFQDVPNDNELYHL